MLDMRQHDLYHGCYGKRYFFGCSFPFFTVLVCGTILLTNHIASTELRFYCDLSTFVNNK